MSDFFEPFNAASGPRPQYRRNSEIEMFKFMILKNIGPTTTSVGPTFRVQCKVRPEQPEIFFFLNDADYRQMTEARANDLMDDVQNGRNPFVFVVKTAKMRRTVVVKYSDARKLLYDDRKMVRIQDIPDPVKNEMDFVELSRNGIVFTA
ncbi:uncharacterized protein LOC113217351 [Frankliniella occidentalis]|uniref:Uncharacterized protein LOC113217351 n=1 Tax=Frankliniella occidentalis TaxID=133901 RepID=A0A6J1TJT2_FRAOC|nr:uncharacterized protein LOC113217351 [Frankliniella occidentalis]